MSAPLLTIEHAALSTRPVRLRLPFHFGNTTVTATEEAHLTLHARINGRPVRGYAAQLMVPRWFDKSPQRDIAATIEQLRRSCQQACRMAEGQSGTAAALSCELRDALTPALAPEMPRLAAHFGPALLEMAMIDAICFDAGMDFARAARADLFGLVALPHAGLSAQDIRDVLARIAPQDHAVIRHTIGFTSPLTAEEVENAPADGLPVSLDQVFAEWGVTALKIKLSGDPDADMARLSAIAQAIQNRPLSAVTLDANEQYRPDAFTAFCTGFERAPDLARLRDALVFVEQPFDRDTALSMPPGVALPCIIDESDSYDDAYADAARLGWAGVSVKSCKGVLRALLNHVRVQMNGGRLSAEDLTCQPGLCWGQDTIMALAVGAAHLERNGHFFGGGMQGASDAEKRAFLRAHPDLYCGDVTAPRLRIEGGRVRTGSLNAPGFGSSALRLE